jgi:hypothetical protein
MAMPGGDKRAVVLMEPRWKFHVHCVWPVDYSHRTTGKCPEGWSLPANSKATS